MKKNRILNLLNWIIGIFFCSLGICFSTKADFGLSMISAPPYIIHVYMEEFFPWYTQGTSEYIWQALIMVLMIIVIRKFKPKFLLSFLTAVIAGLSIDAWFLLLGGSSAYENFYIRILSYLIGTIITSISIAFVFRTTLPVQMYEAIVIEISESFKLDRNRVKFCNDTIMLIIAMILSFALTGGFTGIGAGTIITTAVNAPLISFFGKIIDKIEKKEK